MSVVWLVISTVVLFTGRADAASLWITDRPDGTFDPIAESWVGVPNELYMFVDVDASHSMTMLFNSLSMSTTQHIDFLGVEIQNEAAVWDVILEPAPITSPVDEIFNFGAMGTVGIPEGEHLFAVINYLPLEAGSTSMGYMLLTEGYSPNDINLSSIQTPDLMIGMIPEPSAAVLALIATLSLLFFPVGKFC